MYGKHANDLSHEGRERAEKTGLGHPGSQLQNEEKGYEHTREMARYCVQWPEGRPGQECKDLTVTSGHCSDGVPCWRCRRGASEKKKRART